MSMGWTPIPPISFSGGCEEGCGAIHPLITEETALVFARDIFQKVFDLSAQGPGSTNGVVSFFKP